MRKLFFLLPQLLLLFSAFFSVPLSGQIAFFKEGEFDYLELFEELDPIQVRLLAEENSIQGGRPFWVGIHLDIAKKWHTYWKNPGDLGLPTRIKWTLPPGFSAGPIRWPLPKRFVTKNFTNFGYEEKVLLLTKITPPAKLPAGKNVTFSAEVDWYACHDRCVPGTTQLSLSLPITSPSPTAPAPLPNQEFRESFFRAHHLLPQQLWNVRAERHGKKILFYLLPAGPIKHQLSSVTFFPESEGLIDYHVEQKLLKTRSGYLLTVAASDQPITTESTILKGILISENGWNESDSRSAFEVNIPIKNPPEMIELNGKEPTRSKAAVTWEAIDLGSILPWALLGGLLLNLMPCVFPVISLKLLHFIELSKESSRRLFLHGSSFTLGVLVAYWILGGTLLFFRFMGESIGWGFQMQEPLFVAFLTALFFLASLSLFGIFELPTLSIKQPHKYLSSSFFSGALATLVATPCVGPFLAPVLGVTLAIPPLQAIIIFTVIGLGMALPYLIFSLLPNAIALLPRPGEWMVTFRQLMGLLMALSAIWLIWVFGAQTDSNATALLLLGCYTMGSGFWINSKWKEGTLGKKRYLRRVLLLIFLLIGFSLLSAASGVAGISPAALLSYEKFDHQQEKGDSTAMQREAYSAERLLELRQQGTPVFVEYSAKWCLICQTNKAFLYSPSVSEKFREEGVIHLVADWTKKDPHLTADIEKFGGSGVPLYLLYGSDPQQPPEKLPSLLSHQLLIDSLEKIE